jgi:hypothetical protein
VQLKNRIVAHAELGALLRFSRLARSLRYAFLPELAEGDGGLTDSKFGGRPALLADESWPRCPNCGQAMQLGLQLDLARLPAGAPGAEGAGLIQVFLCTNTEPICELETEAHRPGVGRSKLVRLIASGTLVPPTEDPKFPGEFGTLPPRRIAAFKRIEDYPAREEAGIGDGPVLEDNRATPGAYDALMPFEGDKLGGWPRWLKAKAYPPCPECWRPMNRLISQIASRSALDWTFGDRRLAYLVQCPAHPHRLELTWQ